jgi:hemoglobin/transferrin/lactoferrin receptor protein
MKTSRALAISAPLLLGFALPFVACRSALAAAESEGLEEVIVAAKRLRPLQHVPATVTVIDREHVTLTLSDDIRDLVRYQPGLSVRTDGVRFGLDSFAIRGIGGDRVVAEIDGIGVAESFTVGALADSGRVFTDVDFIERVEILRGPASALYGSDAIGGVVRFQTLDPDDLLRADSSFASQMRAGYRGDTDGWSATTLNAWSSEGAEVMLGYVHRASEEADIAGSVRPNPRESRSNQVLAKLVLPDLSAGPIELALEAGRMRDHTEINALLGSAPRFVNTTAMTGRDTAEQLRLSLEQALAPSGLLVDEAVWRVHAQRTMTQQITDERRRAAPPRSPAVELQRAFELEDEALGAEMTLAKAFQAGTWSHEIVYGLELDMGRITERRDGYERNLETGVVSPAILGEVFPLRDFPITRRTEAGAYIQDEFHAADSRWRTTAGVRFDVYRLRAREDEIYREDNPSARPVDLDEQALAPKLAISYQLANSTNVFAQYAQGFRSPPFEDVNIGLEIPLFNYRALPNPDLEAETSDSFELGLRTSAAAWSATLSAHYTKFEDFIESRQNIGRDPVSGMTLFQSRNLERARLYGIELATTFDLQEWSPKLQGWSIALNAAWSRGENTVTDQPLNSVEPLKANFIVDYDAHGSWGVRLAATASASKDDVADSPTPLFRTDGYLVFDAFTYISIAERGSLNLGLSNLTDERYIEWGDVRGRASDDPLIAYATNPGRNVSLTMSWAF